jgi:hypothetical protein
MVAENKLNSIILIYDCTVELIDRNLIKKEMEAL